MSDLFSLVKQERVLHTTQFWGKYSYLNDAVGSNLNDQALLNLQIAKLKIYENKTPSLQAANNFLNQIQKINPEQIQEEILDLSYNQIYQRVLQILNAGLYRSDNSLRKDLSEKKITKDELNSKAEELQQELDTLLSLINYANKDELKSTFFEVVKGGYLKAKTKEQIGFNYYSRYKANEAEKLMVQGLMAINKNWRAIQTGNMYNKGQQLLQDAFVFDIGLDISFGKDFQLTLKSKKNKTSETKSVKSLQEFFDIYEGLSGEYSIHLSDELYDKMKQIAVMTAQAKSGANLQMLLNQNKRNSISLHDLGPTPALIGLLQLYRLSWIDENNESESLSKIANYCLSKGIALTNIVGNDIYFTKDGFITASKWMQMYKTLLKFNPSVNKVNNSYLSTPRPYSFFTL